MDTRLDLDDHANLVRIVLSGRCSFRDFGRLFVRLLKLKARPGLRILTDIRDADLVEGSFRGVSSVESTADQFIDAYLPVRQAIVVNSVLNFGIARMYEGLAEKDGYDVHVFKNVQLAETWLLEEA